MKNLAGGIDVGSERHHVVIMNDKKCVEISKMLQGLINSLSKKPRI